MATNASAIAGGFEVKESKDQKEKNYNLDSINHILHVILSKKEADPLAPLKEFCKVNNLKGILEMAFLIAAKYNQVACCDYLLSLGIEIGVRDFEGKTALHLAALNGHLQMVQFLLSQGAQLGQECRVIEQTLGTFNLTSKTRVDTRRVVEKTELEVAQQQWGKRSDIYKFLQAAYELFIPKDIKELQEKLNAGHSLNLRNAGGESLLHVAVKYEYLEMAIFLVNNGVEADIKNSHGFDIFYIADSEKLCFDKNAIPFYLSIVKVASEVIQADKKLSNEEKINKCKVLKEACKKMIDRAIKVDELIWEIENDTKNYTDLQCYAYKGKSRTIDYKTLYLTFDRCYLLNFSKRSMRNYLLNKTRYREQMAEIGNFIFIGELRAPEVAGEFVFEIVPKVDFLEKSPGDTKEEVESKEVVESKETQEEHRIRLRQSLAFLMQGHAYSEASVCFQYLGNLGLQGELRNTSKAQRAVDLFLNVDLDYYEKARANVAVQKHLKSYSLPEVKEAKESKELSELSENLCAKHKQLKNFLKDMFSCQEPMKRLEEYCNTLTGEVERQELLVMVVQLNRLDALKLLVRRGFCVNSQNFHKETALGMAAIYGSPEMVRFLVSKKSDCNAEMRGLYFAATPVMLAARYGRIDNLKTFIDLDRTLINQVSSTGTDVFTFAAIGKQFEVLKFFHSFFPKFYLRKNDYGLTLYKAALAGGCRKIIDWLETLEKEPWLKRTRDDRSNYNIAAQYGHLDLMSIFSKDPVSFTPEDDYNALNLAARNGHLKVVEFILEKESKFLSKQRWLRLLPTNDPLLSMTRTVHPFMEAIKGGHKETVKYFLDVHRCKYKDKLSNGYTTLMAAIEGGSKIFKDHIHEKEPELWKDKTNDGMSTFIMAASVGDLEWVKTYNSNCYLSSVTKAGLNPLMAAARNGHLNVVNYLLDELPSFWNSRDNEGHTPYMKAAEGGHIQVMKRLHACEPDIWQQTCKNGDSAFNLAARNNHVHVLQYLFEELDNKLSSEVANKCWAEYVVQASDLVVDISASASVQQEILNKKALLFKLVLKGVVICEEEDLSNELSFKVRSNKIKSADAKETKEIKESKESLELEETQQTLETSSERKERKIRLKYAIKFAFEAEKFFDVMQLFCQWIDIPELQLCIPQVENEEETILAISDIVSKIDQCVYVPKVATRTRASAPSSQPLLMSPASVAAAGLGLTVGQQIAVGNRTLLATMSPVGTGGSVFH